MLSLKAMARKQRVEFPGAYYHVTARGINDQKVFISPSDYIDYLMRLKGARKRFRFVVYAYCLLPNSLQLLVGVNGTPLSRIMQIIQSGYVQSFNLRHRRSGALFLGRYKSVLCYKGESLLKVLREINLYPMSAGQVSDPKDYLWSSYRQVIGLERAACCDRERILKLFGRGRAESVEGYKKFISDGISVGERKEDSCLNIPMDEILDVVSEFLGISREEIISEGRSWRSGEGKAIAVYLARELNGATFGKMGSYFSKGRSSMYCRYNKIKKRVIRSESFALRMRELRKKIEQT